MSPEAFCKQTRVMIVAGKGGVGKTTVSATLATVAARCGLSTLVVEVEGRSELTAIFGHQEQLTYEQLVLSNGSEGAAKIRARTLTPDEALVEYLEDHGLRRLSKRMAATGTLDVVATAVPGIKDILVLGKVKQLERMAAAGLDDAPDFIVVDAPAAGHAVSFLASAHGLLDAFGSGPVRNQASEVVEMLKDPSRCQVLLVTLPEETPVNEVIETAFHLEDRARVHLAGVVVNAVAPKLDLSASAADAAAAAGVSMDPADLDALDRAADFRRHRQDLEAAQMDRLSAGLPLAQISLPFLYTTELGPLELDALSDAFVAAVEDLEATVAIPGSPS
ncbi:MAG: ArsA family ATPase [Acidimicrobiales bacterium]